MNPNVDEFILKAKRWQDEIVLLRTFLLESELKEELKWKQPCYTFNKSNVVIIAAFKEYCALAFFKGALFKNSNDYLVSPGENSQAVKQLRFNSVDKIIEQADVIKSTIVEAIKVEKSGKKIDFKQKDTLEYPVELLDAFEADSKFMAAFEALTPGRKRGYNLHFTGSKKSITRTSRIEDCKPKILLGKGLQDCICGLSKRMPRCDGSHKFIT